MMGALVGDIVGSVYEFDNTKSTDFDMFCGASTFTDDSVMTLAVAKWLLEDEAHTIHYLIYCMQEQGNHHPNAGYGGHFYSWIFADNPRPYNSWGNGAGMRVSPVGLYAKTLDEALALAALTASVSHNHPEGVKGAQAIAKKNFYTADMLGKTITFSQSKKFTAWNDPAATFWQIWRDGSVYKITPTSSQTVTFEEGHTWGINVWMGVAGEKNYTISFWANEGTVAKPFQPYSVVTYKKHIVERT